MNELTISLYIAGRSYQLNIDKEEEEFFRKASKLIEENVKKYADNFHFKDNQDLLAMVNLQNAVNIIKLENELSFYTNELQTNLYDLDKILSDNL